MGSSPTNLQATVVSGQERVLLTWDPPTTTYDGVRVSMRQHGTTPWIVQFLGTDPSPHGRYVYPTPDMSYDYEVEAVASGVYSTPATLSDYTLPWWSDAFTMCFTNTANGDMLNFGTVKDYGSLKKVRKSKVSSFEPMGAIYAKDWKSRAKYATWPSMVLAVFSYDVLTDGTFIDNSLATIPMLESFFPPAMPLLLWRDWSGFMTYVTIVGEPEIQPVEGDGWEVTIAVEERKPPASPFTLPR